MHPQLPADDEASAALLPFADFPALNTESCSVWRLLVHLGQAISCFADITIVSYRAWQSLQTYS